MDILDIRSYTGRNIHSHKPMIRALLDLNELYDTPTRNICNFNNTLLELFPGLKNHYCSCGHEGGFAERLTEGTYLTHVTEHLTLELQNILGYDVHYGKSRLLKVPSIYYMAFEFKNEKCATECFISAVKIVNSLISGKAPDAEEMICALKKTAVETGLGPSTEAIFNEAAKRGIPVKRMCNSSILQLGYGKNTRFAEASLTDSPNCISVDFAGNKHLTKEILATNKIPVPYGDIAYTRQSAEITAALIGYPVVIKPFDANQGKGVTVDISNESEIEGAFSEAVKYSNAVIVEKYVKGRDFRILVIGGKVSAAAERIPPFITGNGIHSIRELTEIENSNPLRGDDHEKPLTKIKLGNTVRQVLLRSGFDENSIPAPGDKVYLRQNGNLSTGGTARDCTGEVHPRNAELAVKAAALLGLDIAGIDITAEDISKPIDGINGAVIEINAAPGLRMHLYPSVGTPRNVASDIIEMLYPKGKAFTIPIVSVTGTNGKTTTTRLLAHTIGLTGKKVGMTSTSGIFIDGKCILKGDDTGSVSAGLVLSDKRVEVAVLETARGGILKKGLGYDLADVGVIVNVSEDHLGMDEVNTLEELAMVKALVIEAVKPEGYAVLNADDLMTPFFLERKRSKTILFSKDCENPLILKQKENCDRAVYVREGSIYSFNGKYERLIIGIKEIPITFNGSADCNIENSLAAVCALSALNIPVSIIRSGLTSFMPDAGSNPGRFNIFDMDGFQVMLDYGHNPAGYTAVISCIKGMGSKRLVGIIGMPGDRSDKSISEVGEMCGREFTRLYIKEDNDLRGRGAGETADILYNTAISAGMEPGEISVIYSEPKALETALLDAQPGDLIVMFYEEFEQSMETLERYRRETEQSEIKTAETVAG